MDYDKPLYPYIGMTDGCSVLAKVSISRGAPPPFLPPYFGYKEKKWPNGEKPTEQVNKNRPPLRL